MGEFLGWASYDIKSFCPHCNEFYEEDYEHEDCNGNDINDDRVCEEESTS